MSQHTDEIEKTMTLLRDARFPQETKREAPKSVEERLAAIEGHLEKALKAIEDVKNQPQKLFPYPYIPYLPSPYQPYYPPVRIGDYPGTWTTKITASPSLTYSGGTNIPLDVKSPTTSMRLHHGEYKPEG